jgi:Calcineurin-like phosphoesterase
MQSGTAGDRAGRSLATLILLAGLIGFAHASASPIGAEAPIVWTELAPSGLIARAITNEPTCPTVRLDGQAQPMRVRALPSPPDFPVLVCEADVPVWTRSASIGRQRLPLLRRHPARIVVIGDAGCRIEGSMVQACNDPTQWPFAEIAEEAARWRPDLIIHVGDYIYREDPCPPGNDGCAGSPHGDNWATLQADLFTLARALLRAAPWVFVRGNHETCARGGEAWFRFLYPLPMPARCEEYTEPYKIPLGGLDLLILDSAITNDFEEPPAQVAAFRAQFDALRQLATGDSWLITHKPMYAFGHAGEQSGVEQLFIDQQVLQEASANDFPEGIRLFIGGHLHLFETLSFGRGRPPQLVVGNSGTELDPPVTTSLPGLEMAGLEVTSGVNLAELGFVTMQRQGRRWTATLRDVEGEPILRCSLRAEGLSCEPSDSGLGSMPRASHVR